MEIDDYDFTHNGKDYRVEEIRDENDNNNDVSLDNDKREGVGVGDNLINDDVVEIPSDEILTQKMKTSQQKMLEGFYI